VAWIQPALHTIPGGCRIGIVLGAVSGQTWQASYSGGETVAAGAGGALFLGPLLMIMFRRKYPRWWFDWNLELGRFSSRVSVYLALMDDQYPSTDDHQSVTWTTPILMPLAI
jgi:hypothetical protein